MECAIRTDDAMVSRKHSMISFDGSRYWVEDLGSSNGTHVNDTKVQRQALNHNDVVRCGSLWLRYVEEGPMFAGAPGGGGGGGIAATQMVGGGGGLGYASTVATPARPPTFGGSPRPVSVDMGDMGGGDRYRAQAEDFRQQADQARADRDREVAENRRLRAEVNNLQQRLDDQRTQSKETDEVMDGHKRVAEELRSEMESLRERDGKMTQELADSKDELAARTRQLQRVQDETNKMRSETDAAKRQAAELARMKDDGFKKLNDQLAEVEHLREVIREQERMLEERRVALISLEEVIQDLRRDREGRIKEMAAMKGERDELRIGYNRQAAMIQSTDDENRRLGRLISDLQAGTHDSGEVTRLSGQLRDAEFEGKKAEAERSRLADLLRNAEQRIEKLQGDIGKLEDAGSAEDSKANQAVADMRRAEENVVRAEQARVKAEQEKAAVIKDKEDADREIERLRKRIADGDGAAAARPDPGLEKRANDLESKLEEAEYRAQEAQKRLGDIMSRAAKLEDENEELVKKVKEAQQRGARGGGGGGGGGGSEIREKALEVYNSVNDVLAELRVNISVVRDEFDNFAGKNADSRARTIRDAIEAAAGQTEDVKGVLRNLRELAEN
jgi:hypothetical protein